MGFQFTKIQLEATENPNCPQLPSMKGDYFIQGYEVAVKKYKRKITNLEKEKEQLKEQIADIKANCDLAIEGRDVKIMELEKENAELRAKYLQATDEGTSFAHLKSLERENTKLKEQIEKMKCGGNCKHLYHVNTGGCYDAKCDLTYCDCTNCKDKWELRK